MGIDYASDLDSTASILVTRRDGSCYVVSVWSSNRTEAYVIADPTVYVGHGIARRPKPERFFNPDPPAILAVESAPQLIRPRAVPHFIPGVRAPPQSR